MISGENQKQTNADRSLMKHALLRKFVFAACVLGILMQAAWSKQQTIRPGEPWLDSRGRPIQAHGGGILREGDTFYWFGEDYLGDADPNKRYVSCYSSKDLARWIFRGHVLALNDPENLGTGWMLQRPKVFQNLKMRKYLMYFHLDVPGSSGRYRLAKLGLAMSDRVDGEYRYLRSFHPLGYESRDIGQFVDDDGAAYIIFEDRPHGFRLAQLSDDYLTVAKEVCFVPEHLEAGAIVRYEGLYYFIGSGLTGWAPNPNKYATAKSLAGPWSKFRDIAPSVTNTHTSQSTFLLKIQGNKTTTVVFMADRWNPATLADSRYIWMPLEIGGGKLRLPKPREWTIDVKTGRAVIIE